MFDIFITANCFSPLDVWSCIYHEIDKYLERQVTHMTKTNTTQVLDEYPPPLPELAEHPQELDMMQCVK